MRIYFSLYLIPVVVVALALFWLVLRDDRRRLWLVVGLSLAILALLHPVFAVVAVGLLLVTQQVVAAHAAGRLSGGRTVLLAVLVTVVTLAIGKYGRSAAVAMWGGDEWITARLLMPLGISYFVFRLMQYVFDHLRGVITDNSFLRLAAFMMFIPTFPAGPLETYQGFYGKRSVAFDRQLFYVGLRRIAVGYFKKVFIVDFLFALAFGELLHTMGRPGFDLDALGAFDGWVYVIAVFVRAYFDLSAYTDLAIGFSALFGFRIMENFNLPFLSKNLGDFWRRWHISLSSWVRNNVYFPVYGLTRKPWLGLYLSMLTMGLWHYVNLNWTFWGLYHGTGLVIVARWERYKKARKKRRRKAGQPVAAWYERFIAPAGYVVTFLYVALGYAFVATHTFRHAAKIVYACVKGPLEWLGIWG
ncbi:MAG TPA: MBOAT family O-acyltransferase [Thermoleophilia bacterium]|nr:MBOAT family O-acyltransferase [Thermoleophilia bacterium]